MKGYDRSDGRPSARARASRTSSSGRSSNEILFGALEHGGTCHRRPRGRPRGRARGQARCSGATAPRRRPSPVQAPQLPLPAAASPEEKLLGDGGKRGSRKALALGRRATSRSRADDGRGRRTTTTSPPSRSKDAEERRGVSSRRHAPPGGIVAPLAMAAVLLPAACDERPSASPPKTPPKTAPDKPPPRPASTASAAAHARREGRPRATPRRGEWWPSATCTAT